MQVMTPAPIGAGPGGIPYDPNTAPPSWYKQDTGGAGWGGSRPGSVAPPEPTAAQNTALAEQLQQGVYNQLPGYAGDMSNIGANIASETAGKLPTDVLTQIQQQMAERGVATGTSGSPTSNAAMLQALGLTSLNLTSMGQQQLSSVLPGLPGASTAANPNFYTTPQQQYEANLQNTIFAAMPDPSATAQAELNAAKAGLSAGGAAGGMGSFSLPPTPNTDVALGPDDPGYVNYKPSYPSYLNNPLTPTPGTGPTTAQWLASIGSQYYQQTAGATAPQQGWEPSGGQDDS